MPYFTIKDLVNDWKEIGTDAREIEEYHSIYEIYKKKKYEVLRVSWYLEEHDGLKELIETPTRIFTDKAAQLCRATRDLGYARVITDRKKPTIIIETGKDILAYWARVEGVPLDDLIHAIRDSPTGQALRKIDVARIDRQKKKARANKAQSVRADTKNAEQIELLEKSHQAKIKNLEFEAKQELIAYEAEASTELDSKINEVQAEYDLRIKELEEDSSRMRENLQSANGQIHDLGGTQPLSQTDCALARSSGPVNPKRLPGSAGSKR